MTRRTIRKTLEERDKPMDLVVLVREHSKFDGRVNSFSQTDRPNEEKTPISNFHYNVEFPVEGNRNSQVQ